MDFQKRRKSVAKLCGCLVIPFLLLWAVMVIREVYIKGLYSDALVAILVIVISLYLVCREFIQAWRG